MLAVQNLTIRAKSGALLLDDISLSVQKGEALAITGQSGSGKTTLLRAILGLTGNAQQITCGGIFVDQQNIALCPGRQRRAFCGTELGFISQSPMTAFDSRLRIGRQMTQTLTRRMGLSNVLALELCEETLVSVNLADARRVMQSKPHQLSGGMLQRVAVAMLLAMKPRYILADEATSALDDENRDLLLALLRGCLADAGILFITHDACAIKELCARTAVLHEGRLVEYTDTHTLFQAPQSEWGKEFVSCCASMEQEAFRWKAL